MSKSILLAVTFFLIGNLVIIGLGINNAAEQAKIETRQKMRAVVSYEVDYEDVYKRQPHNRVEYFVSNFDYYQPEAYMPKTDTYIEKNAMTNDELDMLRMAAVNSVLERRDTIIVASVCLLYTSLSKQRAVNSDVD